MRQERRIKLNEKGAYRIPKASWTECEQGIKALAERDLTQSKTPKDVLRFLEEIGFYKDKGLTNLGEAYYQSKFVLNDESDAKTILTEAMKRFEPTQVICQILWARDNLNRDNVYRLLLLKKHISVHKFRPHELGSFLMLLNSCDILKYSKKTGRVKILYNPRTEDESKPLRKFLSPETPYSNIRALKECLRKCKNYIWWFDKYFSARGLEPLSDEADGTRIEDIRVLTGPSDKVNEKLLKEFKRFEAEVRNRGITATFRVVCDKQLLQHIHDRWIVSDNVCFNIPSIDTIYKGQYSEMRETENKPPFEKWWTMGLDLLKDWNRIRKQIVSMVAK